MNRITQILIEDVGIGKHEAIVRAMNLGEDEFLKWANRCYGKVLDTIHELDVDITIDNYQLEFYNYIQEQKEDALSAFSNTLCQHLPEIH